MRYFLGVGLAHDVARERASMTLAMAPLSVSITLAALSRAPVAARGQAQRLAARLSCAPLEAVDVAAVAATPQDHLSVAPGTVIQPRRTARHRRHRADEGWTCARAIAILWALC